MITTTPQLEQLAAFLQTEKIIAFDLEADSMHHYREQVCLIQVTAAGKNWIIDPFLCTDLSCLKPIFSDPQIVKVLHGADYDVRMLHRCFGIEINNLFDTMIACQILGESACGLAAVLKKRYSVELDKKYQQADWSKRPLPAEMLDYAAKDTTLLIPLYGELVAELEKKGRLDWLLEECELLSRVRGAERNDEFLCARFKGAARMRRDVLANVEALLRFRDSEAQRRDLPPFKILGNDSLHEIADRNPSSVADLNGIHGLSPKLVERYNRAILTAVKAGRAMAKDTLPQFESKRRVERTALQERRLKSLKEWRSGKSSEVGIDPGLLINNAQLEALADAADVTEEAAKVLKRWQSSILLDELKAVVDAEK